MSDLFASFIDLAARLWWVPALLVARHTLPAIGKLFVSRISR